MFIIQKKSYYLLILILLSTSVERSIAAWQLSSREIIIGAALGATLLTYKLYKRYHHKEKESSISTTPTTLRLRTLNTEPFETLIHYFPKSGSSSPSLLNSLGNKSHLSSFAPVTLSSSSAQLPVKAELSTVQIHTSENQAQPILNNSTIVGLENWGASCYFNSMIQCLIALDPLKQFMLANKHVYTPGSLADRYSKFIELYQDFVRKKQSISAKTIYNNLYSPLDHLLVQRLARPVKQSPWWISWLSKWINNGTELEGQQDTQEALNLFIEHLESDALEPHKKQVEQNIQLLFNQQLQSIVTCKNCNTPFSKGEPAYILNLPLVSEASQTVEECLTEYFKKEELTGSNQYWCSYCNSKQDASKQLQTQNAPEILVIMLIRFVFKDNSAQKISAPVRFPIDELRPYASYNPAGPAYELASFISHSGGITGGHYIAHVKSSNKWHRCNDSSVEEISLDTMHQFEQSGTGDYGFTPYVLFYKKKH